MKKILIGFLSLSTFLSQLSFADTEWYQTLDIMSNLQPKEKREQFYSQFEKPVSAYIKKYNNPESGEDSYLYMYIVNEPNATELNIDISCRFDKTGALVNDNTQIRAYRKDSPLIEVLTSDPILKNPKGRISQTGTINIKWKFNNNVGKQVMWFFSPQPPTKRKYEMEMVRDNDSKDESDVSNNRVVMSFGKYDYTQGPSCKS